MTEKYLKLKTGIFSTSQMYQNSVFYPGNLKFETIFFVLPYVQMAVTRMALKG